VTASGGTAAGRCPGARTPGDSGRRGPDAASRRTPSRNVGRDSGLRLQKDVERRTSATGGGEDDGRERHGSRRRSADERPHARLETGAGSVAPNFTAARVSRASNSISGPGGARGAQDRDSSPPSNSPRDTRIKPPPDRAQARPASGETGVRDPGHAFLPFVNREPAGRIPRLRSLPGGPQRRAGTGRARHHRADGHPQDSAISCGELLHVRRSRI
jgi:hypothetical protein